MLRPNRASVRALPLLAALALGACASPDPSAPLLCQSDAECPTGLVCRGGRCALPGSGPDGGAVDGGISEDGGIPEDGGVPVDGGAEDGGVPEDGGVAQDAGTGTVGFGEPCASHGECLSQICLQTGQRSICTRLCSDDCPTDYVCKAFVLDRNRIVNLCVPFGDVYCVSCAASNECPASGDKCTDLGGASFCTRDCSASGACPPGFECRDVAFEQTVEGRTDGGVAPDGGEDAGASMLFRQCLPASGQCPGCVDADGDNYGAGAECLGPDCDDSNPNINPGALEICNEKDDNCNGLTDEGFDLRTDNDNCGACNNPCDTGAGQQCCEGACIEPATSAEHCGTCGNACQGDGVQCCGGSCRGTLSDPEHCGGCGLPCTNEHGQVSCSEGQCQPTCAAGFGDCDDNRRNGCETALSTVQNCGACGVGCTNTFGTTECSGGRCQPSCQEGYADCDGNPNNGCESNLRFGAAPVLHCGACNLGCSNAHGTTSCDQGACLPVCEDGWGDCDGNKRNGCETDLKTTTAHCGACGTKCDGTNAQAVACVDGACQITCNPGFYDCNHNPADGCEADLGQVTTCGGCALDTECPPGFFCNGTSCTKKNPLGESCTVGPAANPGRECQSGNCVDGVCCDDACVGQCRACNLNGTVGHCTFVQAGQVPPLPRPACTSDPVSAPCGQNGKCDGAGGCQLYPSGTICQAQACATATSQANAHTCDGLGNCQTPIPAETVCVPYTCVGQSCGSTCDIQAQTGCAPGFECVAGDNGPTCKATGGTPCAPEGANTGCSSGWCRDGLCCDKSCDGVCERCDLPESSPGANDGPGTCKPIPAGADPDQECTAQEASTCGTTGVCNGAGACQLHAAGTVCTPQTCSGGVQTSAGQCDGSGTCQPGAELSCSPYACNVATQACFASCSLDVECQQPVYGCASDHTCKKVNGQPCSEGAECKSGSCTDGVCCESSCKGTCESCNLPNRAGFCDPIALGQDPQGECPAQPASTCGRAGGCNGARACTLYSEGTVCAARSCTPDLSGSNRADLCNGLGTCSDQGVEACGKYKCNPGTGTCRTSCGSTSDCASGYSCKAGVCLKNDGQPCSSPSECYNGACCGNVCTNPNTDPNNCGGCGTVCTNAHGSTSCVGGTCSPVCSGLWGNCNGNPIDGCETALNTTSNCGACGVGCSLPHASATSCSTGTCTVVSCNNGYANCDSSQSNGCEKPMNTCSSGCCSTSGAGAYQGDNDGCTTRTTQFGSGEKCYTVQIREDRDSCHSTEAILQLNVPSGVDYDLYVTVSGGATCSHWNGSSWVSGCSGINGTGSSEYVWIARGESCFLGLGDGTSQTMNVTVEIRWYSGAACGNWSLTVLSGEGC